MPNWCSNTMVVKGPKPELKRFLKAMKVKEMQKQGEIKDDKWVETGEKEVEVDSLNHLDPIPQDLINTVAGSVSEDKKADHVKQMQDNLDKYGYKDWYDYACSVWGSKWGASEVYVSKDNCDDGSISLSFQSAWSPCNGLIARISEKFPKLVFGIVFTEEAEFFAGWVVIHNGRLIVEGEGETEEPKEISEMPQDTDDEVDAYYEAQNDWRCNRDDSMNESCDKAMELTASWIRSNQRRKEKLTFREYDDYLLDKS